MKLFGIKLKFNSSLWTFIWFLFAFVAITNINNPNQMYKHLASLAMIIPIVYGSVLFHEYAHAFVAKFFGYDCKLIELHIFGGVAHIFTPFEKIRQEFYIILAGPVSNFVLAFLCYPFIHYSDFFAYMVIINFSIGAFNLFLPLFPMDGGRLIRSTFMIFGHEPLQAYKLTYYLNFVVAVAGVVYFAYELNPMGVIIIPLMLFATISDYKLYSYAIYRNEGIKKNALGIIDNHEEPGTKNLNKEQIEELKFLSCLLADYTFVIENCLPPDIPKSVKSKLKEECNESLNFSFNHFNELQKYRNSGNYWDLIDLAESRLKGISNELLCSVC